MYYSRKLFQTADRSDWEFGFLAPVSCCVESTPRPIVIQFVYNSLYITVVVDKNSD